MRYFGLGFLAAIIWVYTLAQFPVRSLFIFIIMAISIIAASSAWRYADQNAARLATGFVTASAVLAASGIYMAATVIHEAEVSASGRPFCLQVASPSDYTPARALLDLSPLTMRATTAIGRSMTHHAILVVTDPVGTQLFHWSYHKRQFVPGALNDKTPGYGPAIVCEPDKNFASHLPKLIPNPTDSVFVRFSDHEAYRIPLTYQPRWSGGSGRHLALQMIPPEFTPSAFTSGRHSDEVFIEWGSVWLTSLLQTQSSVAVQQQTSAYGLTRQVLGEAHTRYVRNLGPGVTLIDCQGGGNSNEPSCQHRFLNGGRHITFRHRAEDIPNWHELEASLVARLASFGAAAAPTPPSSRP